MPLTNMKSYSPVVIKTILFFLFVFVFIFLIIHIASTAYIYNDIDSLPVTETALIPGASVNDEGSLSPVLIDRSNAAIKLYKANKVEKILVSGDNSTTTYNEVNPVRIYLLEHGVREKDISLDHAGFDTYSSMYRARDVFLVHSVTVVTQSFHLPRAVFLARALGLRAYGFNADSGHYLFKNYIRESLADVKAVYNLLFHTKPKYLGEVIPISEDQLIPSTGSK